MCGGLRLVLNCLDRAIGATDENLEYWRANIQAAERVLKMLGYLGKFNKNLAMMNLYWGGMPEIYSRCAAVTKGG